MAPPQTAPKPSLRNPENQRAIRHALSRAACAAVDDDTRKRLSSAAHCGADKLVLRHRETRQLALADISCGKKYCPECGLAWSDRLTQAVRDAVEPIDPTALRHLVLTVPNAAAGDLSTRTDQLQAAWREWRNQGRRPSHGAYWRHVDGYSCKLEIGWNRRTGWHPHLHVLVHAPGGLSLRRDSAGRRAWRRVTTARGAPATESRGVYVTQVTSKSVAREVAKYAHKPLQLQHLPTPRWHELAIAAHRRRFCASHGTLRHPSPDRAPGAGVWQPLGSLRLHVARALSTQQCDPEILHALEEYLTDHPEHAHNWPEVFHPLPQAHEGA